MKLYEKIIDYLEFRKFDKRVVQIYQSIPSIERYKESVSKDWKSIGEAKIKANKSTIKQIIPLKSLRFGEDYGYGRFVKFSVKEFDEVMYKTINRKLHTFFMDNYSINNKGVRYSLYKSTKDTFNLLLDAISEEYHLNHENEIIELLEFLKSEFNEVIANKATASDIKYRMEIELEYIKRRKEEQQFDF